MNMEDHSNSTTFFCVHRSQCLYLSAELSDGSSSSSDSIFSNESKKEPVQSQQFLVKKDCNSETGLKNSYYSNRNMKEPG